MAFEEVIIGNARLIHGDCREVLPLLPKHDLLLTDPPYLGLTGGAPLQQGGVGLSSRVSTTLGDEWGANLEWAGGAETIAAKGLIVFCSHQGLCETRAAFSQTRSIALLTWYKRNTPAAMKWVPRHTAEFAWVLVTGGGLEWHKLDSTVFDVPNLNAGCVSTGERITNSDGSVFHPSQKPLQLMALMLRVNPRSVVDPFMGTGTTGVACAQRGVAFTGIERERKYFDIACERISRAQAQGSLLHLDATPVAVQQVMEL